MEFPKVSIIIPTYNRAHYLEQAIKSVLMQDYSNLEVIVSDNASTDNTQDVIRRFLYDKRLTYIRNPKNLGSILNWRNALYDYSSGEWVLILSDDDYLIDKSYIFKAIELINQYQNICLVHANYIIKDENLKKITKTDFNLPEFIDGKAYFLYYRQKDFPHIHSTLTCLFNRVKALEVKAFSKDIYSADTSLWLRLMLNGNVGFIKDHVAVYRLHQGNESFNIDVNKDIDVLNDLKDIYSLAKKYYFLENDLNKWLGRQVNFTFLWRFNIYLKMRKKRIAWILFKEYYKNYPKVMKVFLKSKNLLMFVLVSNVLVLARQIKKLFRKGATYERGA